MKKNAKIEGAVLAGLVLILALVWYFGLRQAGDPKTGTSVARHYAPLGVENQELHWSKCDRARKTQYEKTLRDIFSENAPPPQQPPTPNPAPPDPGKITPPAPVVSPLPVKFYGYGVVPANGAKLAFFTNGDDVFIVGEGETLMGRFRILRIGKTNLEYEQLSSGLRGTAILEEAGPAA